MLNSCHAANYRKCRRNFRSQHRHRRSAIGSERMMWTKRGEYFEGSPTQGHKKTSFIHKRNKSFNAHRRVVIRALFSHLAQHLPTLAPSTGNGGRGHGLYVYVLEHVVPCGHRRRTGQFLLSTKWSLLCSADADAAGLLHVTLFHVDFNDSNYGAARRKSFLSIACIIVIVSALSSPSLSFSLYTVASKLLCFVWPFHCVGVVRSLRLPVCSCSWSSSGTAGNVPPGQAVVALLLLDFMLCVYMLICTRVCMRAGMCVCEFEWECECV